MIFYHSSLGKIIQWERARLIINQIWCKVTRIVMSQEWRSAFLLSGVWYRVSAPKICHHDKVTQVSEKSCHKYIYLMLWYSLWNSHLKPVRQALRIQVSQTFWSYNPFCTSRNFKRTTWTMPLQFPLSSALTRTQSYFKGTVKLTAKYIYTLPMLKNWIKLGSS